MWKKAKKAAQIIMGALIGVYISTGIYDYVYLTKFHPEVYAIQSAPWYTGLLVRGLVMIPVILICVVVIIVAGGKSRK